MRRRLELLALIGALAACSPAKAPEAPPATPAVEEGPMPSVAATAAFPGCTWGEVRAAGVSIWSFACPKERLVADEALPGFVRESDGRRLPTIRIFAKAADAPIDAILPAARAASTGAETCAFEPAGNGDYLLMPTGAARTAYDAFVKGASEGPSLPCGPLGPSEAGSRIFRVVPGAPDKVVVVDTGSDLPIFDVRTIRASK